MSVFTVFGDGGNGSKILTRGVPDASCLGFFKKMDKLKRLFIAPRAEVSGLSCAFSIERLLRVVRLERILAGEAVVTEGDQDFSHISA